MLRIEDVSEDNVDDVFKVCSFSRLDNPLQRQGCDIKRRWLLDTLKKYGSLTKIAYLDEKPVAQILYYPEHIIPSIVEPRVDVVVVHCIYNPFPEARGRGAGTALIESLVSECKKGIPCLNGRACRFIASKPFETGEGISLEAFYGANGFKKEDDEMFLEISASYEPRIKTQYRPLPDDEGKAVVLYNPFCEYSYPFAVRVMEFLREIEPSLQIELIDEWQRPHESIKRGNQWLVVNAVPIKSFWTQKEAFRREVERALSKRK